MTLGRGLESLIPKGGYQKKSDGDNQIRQDNRKDDHTAQQVNLSPQTSPQPAPQPPHRQEITVTQTREEKEPEEHGREMVPEEGKYPSKSGERESVFQIEVEKIKPNPYQPRKEFDPEALQELAQSIREYGVIQPLVVSKVVKETETGADVEYQLIAGERRLLAAKKAGLSHVPAIVRRMNAPRAKLELALIENIQRSDLNPLETAKAYARLQDEFGLTQREVAMRMGRSREVIANALRLLNLPGEIQAALSEGRINESQARILLSAPNTADQMRLFHELINEKTSVRELRRKTLEEPQTSREPLLESELHYWQEQLEEKLGSPVKVMGEKNKGKIVITYYSEEERGTLLKRLLGEMSEG